MRLNNSFFYTLREESRVEESVSGNLLTRAGMIKKTSNGIYMYLPLGYKVIKNIEKIVREELEEIGAGELLMPTLIGNEHFDETNKKELYGKDMFSLEDRFQKKYFLAPLDEELFVNAASSKIKSYKDLPFSIYQIQNKFRDEEKSRYGLIRQREFLMQEAYSFDRDEKGLNDSYKEMYNAYKKIFTRLGIKYNIVKSTTDNLNGDSSEEFQAICDIGEDKLILCDSCGYAANSLNAKCDVLTIKDDSDILTRELVKTENVETIDDVSNYLDVPKDKIVKTLIYKIDDMIYAVLVRGDMEVNEYKLQKLLNASNATLVDASIVEEITGANLGFVGPVGLDIPVIVDNEVMNMKNFVVGANKTDYHYINVNLEDFNYILTGDIRNITINDKCPKCGKEINFKTGIEVGNTFKLGTKYSEVLNLNYLNKDNEMMPVYMGCYSLGLGRCMAAVVEQNNDDKGIIWPTEIAPFKVAIILVNIEDEAQVDAANYLYSKLRENNISTILDDRDERAGVKFNDMDLIGIPVKVVIGNKINDQMVEIKERKKEEFDEISLYDAIDKIEDILDIL